MFWRSISRVMLGAGLGVGYTSKCVTLGAGLGVGYTSKCVTLGAGLGVGYTSASFPDFQPLSPGPIPNSSLRAGIDATETLSWSSAAVLEKASFPELGGFGWVVSFRPALLPQTARPASGSATHLRGERGAAGVRRGGGQQLDDAERGGSHSHGHVRLRVAHLRRAETSRGAGAHSQTGG
jgi:hypothetical protein